MVCTALILAQGVAVLELVEHHSVDFNAPIKVHYVWKQVKQLGDVRERLEGPGLPVVSLDHIANDNFKILARAFLLQVE